VALSKVSKEVVVKLKKLGITTRFDLMLHLPIRYEDHSLVRELTEVIQGTQNLVEGVVVYSEIIQKPRRSLIAQLDCGTGLLYLRYIHFYPSQQKLLAEGNRLRAYGVIRQGYFGLEMIQPKCKQIELGEPTSPTLTPIYSVAKGINSSTIARQIQRTLNEYQFEDIVPKYRLDQLGLPCLAESLKLLHAPPTSETLPEIEDRNHPAWRRIKFDELLAQQLSMREQYRNRRNRTAPLLELSSVSERFKQTLPFALTSSQVKALSTISKDISKKYPMQRLLQGDVGSGKTIVAVLAALQAVESGYQVAIMSPTEILAEQHYRKIRAWLSPFGIEITWLSGSLSRQEKGVALDFISEGKSKIVIGTHALFQEQVGFQGLGLVIIDEQHKFGVQQRLALQAKGEVPHQLMMSATPIPRTLAMSYLANLDVTTIDELPPGRTPIVTKLISDTRRDQVISRVKEVCLQGGQVYWVCPLIEESAALQLQTAEDTFQRLSQDLSGIMVGLVHGRMKKAEKALAMENFITGKTSLLVATTVIEVGVDVPNASLMVIENAERMGLAQLHQLRGRVGRGESRSTCILMFQHPLSDAAKSRLRIIYENSDGFEIARQDMLLRGPGEILGAAQSGVPMLRFADIETDIDLLTAAREVAEEMLEQYPTEAQMHLQRWLGSRQDFLHV
jgi:ATP-dependent DNA helicase RecG